MFEDTVLPRAIYDDDDDDGLVFFVSFNIIPVISRR